MQTEEAAMPTDEHNSREDEEESLPAERIRHEWDETRRPSLVTCESVAAVRNVTPTELTPLNEYIDTEALDRILGTETGSGDRYIEIQFQYEGIDVILTNRNTLELRIDGDDPAFSDGTYEE